MWGEMSSTVGGRRYAAGMSVITAAGSAAHTGTRLRGETGTSKCWSTALVCNSSLQQGTAVTDSPESGSCLSAIPQQEVRASIDADGSIIEQKC